MAITDVNDTILGNRLKKGATSSENICRFGLGLVRPGRFGLLTELTHTNYSALKVSCLCPEWFRL